MKERPILFSGEMIRAIIDGRKTQTRRVVKFSKPFDRSGSWPFVSKFEDGWWVWTDFNPTQRDIEILRQNGNGRPCPHGEPGDRLWVRETFRLSTPNDCACYEPCSCKSGVPVYAATSDPREDGDPPWKPSMFMPRWASRITLEITKVRVERLQDITEEDVKAEGIRALWQGKEFAGWLGPFNGYDFPYAHASEAYAALWDAINAKRGYGWQTNPWVWVIEFRTLSGGPGMVSVTAVGAAENNDPARP